MSIDPTDDPIDRQRFKRLRWTIYAILILAYMTVYFHRMAPGVVAAPPTIW